jgi:hypothetical protein
MRINNYRKNGELFTATVIVFPVYDTVEPTGEETENPVLTHFATMLTHIQTLKHEEVEPVIPTSISKCGLGTSGKSGTNVRSEIPYDRRQNCRKYDIEYALTQERYVCMNVRVCLSICESTHYVPFVSICSLTHHLFFKFIPSTHPSIHIHPSIYSSIRIIVSKTSVPPYVCLICYD